MFIDNIMCKLIIGEIFSKPLLFSHVWVGEKNKDVIEDISLTTFFFKIGRNGFNYLQLTELQL